MQFKHTLGQQDFMSRTENQEQSAEKEGERKEGKWDSGEESEGDGGGRRVAAGENTILDEK